MHDVQTYSTTVVPERATESGIPTPPATGAPIFASEAERLVSFGRSLDALRKDVEADLGPIDVAHIKRVFRLARIAEITGRTLIHFSMDPITFGAGVATLTVHKLLVFMEVGHSVLHGAYDKIPGAEAYRSQGFYWKAPVDEKSWCAGHNVQHHQYTNVAGRDPDLDFQVLRLSDRVRRCAVHRLQPFSNFASWPIFSTAINLHVTGMLKTYLQRGEPRELKFVAKAHATFLKKLVRYYGREYVFFPALAGPLFWKTLLGNALSESVRDVYAAAIIYCGHVGAEDYPAETRGGSRAGFYVLQAEGACNVDLPPALSLLAGALDKQIEHHLFPRLPPNRLRQIAPQVKAICAAHGVKYQSGSWPSRLGVVAKTLHKLSLANVA